MIVHHEVAGSGPPLVLSNSLGTTLDMWAAQMPALTARFSVVRYDHRGHGRSPAPPGPYDIADLASDVLALLDRIGVRRAGFAGISLGGMVGLWLATHVPERVASLALLCTSARLDPGAWHERIAAVRAGGTAAIAGAAMERWFSARFRDTHPDVVERYAEALGATVDDAYIGCCAAIAGMDLRADLANVVAPTLVLAGAEDPAIPPDHSREIADGIADSRLIVLADVHHLPPVERPGAINRRLLDHFRRTMYG